MITLTFTREEISAIVRGLFALHPPRCCKVSGVFLSSPGCRCANCAGLPYDAGASALCERIYSEIEASEAPDAAPDA